MRIMGTHLVTDVQYCKPLTVCVCVCVFQAGCQSFQAKSLPCPQSELISYPLERNVHDALPNPPLNGEDAMTSDVLS